VQRDREEGIVKRLTGKKRYKRKKGGISRLKSSLLLFKIDGPGGVRIENGTLQEKFESHRKE